MLPSILVTIRSEFLISADRIRPDPMNIAKDVEWPMPKTITDVRGFNNLVNHYVRYIENFAELALPLTDLQKSSPPKYSPRT